MKFKKKKKKKKEQLPRQLYEEIRYFKTAADSQDYDFFLFIKHRYKTLTYKNWVIKKNFLQK